MSKVKSLCPIRTFLNKVYGSLGSDPAWDQPNRAVRTRMLLGVGGECHQAPPHSDIGN
jgi:hypothetical protein